MHDGGICMLNNELRGLVRHMEWADAAVWAAVLAEPQARSDTSMRELLHHAHSVHWAYLQIWREDSLDIPDASSFRDLPAIHAWCVDYYQQLGPFLDGLDAESLQNRVEFPWTEDLVKRWGTARPVTLAETILQVTLHTTYHRGQVSRRLRELGGDPQLTDFVAWIWMDRPNAEWRKSR